MPPCLPTAPGGFVVDGIATNNGATPTQMTMEMHMIHLMYGLTDKVTIYTMIMLESLTMDHLRGPMNPAGRGTGFTTHNSGFGDLRLGALFSLYEDEDDDLIFNFGFSVPTGDIYRTSTAPTGGRIAQPLPYPMRLGSGTFNFRPASRGSTTWNAVPTAPSSRRTCQSIATIAAIRSATSTASISGTAIC